VNILLRIKRLALARRVIFTHKAEHEMDADGLSEDEDRPEVPSSSGPVGTAAICRHPMTTNDRILQAIYRAVDEVNESLTPERRIARSPNAVLFGRSGALDSLGLVSLIVATEREVQEEFSAAIALADEKAMSQRNSPFQTVGALAAYIASLIEASPNA
jgi:D-alanine--poly(phosphoribitol) ligase subunit 2